jgi:hypothetical protein
MARIVSKEESKLTLTANGLWKHEGELATHAGIKRFFHRQIRKDARGEFYLYNSIEVAGVMLEEHVYFEVEDTAYFVETLRKEGNDLVVELNTGEHQALDPRTLVQDEAGSVYCRLASSDLARFSRHAMMELEPHLDSDERGIYFSDGAHKLHIGAR